ncbi:hypothetical protein PAECIP112173_03669 [Paenibacillus sp. JJ-100]|uniref:hypothetical protein n=1 Tax=Paenibacillus sp. JJ-100 TaxID=2974896 RepID=UPI0022FF5466|nr:hypothetical protein [Paenibacillus sp. JJ-100]CAI6082730.1 hypothetical protein PAECIP112173_03669 [Paenibacillus sp. JJ-100]
MRKRFSTEKTEWSKTREYKYQQDCEDIVFKFNDELLIQEDKIHLNRNDGQTVTIKPLNHKTFWYETWLKIKDIYDI